MDPDRRNALRDFLKDNIRQEVNFFETDQNLGLIPPPIEKRPRPGDPLFSLPDPDNYSPGMSFAQAVRQRKSRRSFSKAPLTTEDLGYLLWMTQGVRKKTNGVYLRSVPSAGCRHALETYLAILNVDGLEPGIYRYLPSSHQLVHLSSPSRLGDQLARAALDQPFAGRGAVTFLWTAIPYRMEWRYSEASYKVIALDAGHVCQNLYLACETIGAGTCAIAAYRQKLADSLLGVDGNDEFVVYLAPVGKIRNQEME